MATEKKVNKSAEIRVLLEKHPDASPKQIVSWLSVGKKIVVTPNQVSQMKHAMKAKKKPKALKAKKVAKSTAYVHSNGNGHGLDIESIKQIVELGRRVGGMQTLKAWVDAIAD